MREGTIVFDHRQQKFDIEFEPGDCYGGLCAGDNLEVLIDGVWKATRLEKSVDWYFVGLRGVDPFGSRVRTLQEGKR